MENKANSLDRTFSACKKLRNNLELTKIDFSYNVYKMTKQSIDNGTLLTRKFKN